MVGFLLYLNKKCGNLSVILLKYFVNSFEIIEEKMTVKKEGADAKAPAIHMKKIVCIESEATHLILGGTLLMYYKQGT
jgi:hypothetical protein